MLNPKECLGFDDRLVLVVGIPLLALTMPVLFFKVQPFDGVCYWGSAFFAMIHTGVVWLGDRQVFIFSTRRYPSLKDWRKRLVMILLLGIFITGVSCSVVNLVLRGIFETQNGMCTEPPNVLAYTISYMMFFAIGAMYESARFFQLWKKTMVEKEQVERAHLASQLEGLRNQVNPHFLFNSLNTLTYLIPEDSEKAVRFVQQLSKVYRYVLECREAHVIPLREELTFLNSYIYLLKERFGDNLRVSIRGLESTERMAIVPLTLQMLFENAIKHNVISVEKPLTIEVFAEKDKLVVRNNHQVKNQVMDSTGVGLENIRTRYRMLTDQEVEVIASQQYFTVLVPLISLVTA
jgi:sensor histidine kinase YesM